MTRDSASYADVIAFLTRVEDPNEATMNRRETISPQKAAALREQFPGVPEEYIAYLREVGFGSFRECQFMVYSGPGTPDDILGAGVFDWIAPGTRVLCFGDNFCGDLAGFVPDDGWALVELWHDAREIYPKKQSFGAYIRQKMLMGPRGEDRRA